MRKKRLIAPETWPFAYYHCVSRVVDKRMIFEDEEKRQFVNFMRQYEKFCAVRVITYCVMGNHFHLVVEVPAKPEVLPSEGEILAHIEGCDGKIKAFMVAEEIRQCRAAGAHAAAQKVLDGWLSRMWDISEFMKGLKQHFTQWYNKRYERVGTLWENRYHSTIVQGDGGALAMVASYVDLNPVRAGMVEDPKDYLWSGYGAAVSGVKQAVQGLETVLGFLDSHLPPKGQQALERYRVVLFDVGDAGDEDPAAAAMPPMEGAPAEKARVGIPRVRVEAVRAEGGKLSRWEMLRCRVRYFTAGAAIGTRGFVNEIFEARRDRFGGKRKEGARPMEGADFGDLCVLKIPRHNGIGK